MKWSTATALFVALSAGGLGVAVVLNSEPKSPTEVLAEVQAQMGRASFDKTGGIERLQRALDDPRATSNPELASQLYEARSGLFRDLGAYDLARTDLETLLATYRRGDRHLELEIAKLQALDGQLGPALQRTRGLLQRAPDFDDGWALRGELEESSAETMLRAAFKVVDNGLAQVDARAAREILLELTSRDVEDPGRDFLAKQLRDLFSASSGSDLNEVLLLVNEPRAAFKRARSAFAKTMTSARAPSTVVALASSFERAGRSDLAIQLETAARTLEGIAKNPEAAAAYLDDLLRANRIQEAREVLINWNWKDGGSREFFRSAGEVLYKAEDYGALGRVAQGLSNLGGDSGRVWANFFSSIGPIANAENVKNGEERNTQVTAAIARLTVFLQDTDETEPFYGAKDDALLWVSKAYRAVGDTQREQIFLKRALNARPDRSAEAWVRLAETLRQSKQSVPWADVENALTMALDLAPERTASLAPLWFEAGEQALAKQGLTVEQVINEVARYRRTTPVRPVGPSVLTRVAQSHLDNGRGYAAIRAAKEARAEYRNLVPPLDVIIDAELLEPKLYRPEKSILKRIEAAGLDETVEAFMARLPAGRLEGEELVRAIFAAPVRFGKAAVARYYLDRDDPARAGSALLGIDEETAPAQLRVLRAQLLVEGEEWDAALVELARVEEDPRLKGSAYLLQLEALIGAGKVRSLDPIVPRLLAEFPARAHHLLDAADMLSSCGRVDLAETILDRIDRQQAARSPDFYRRRVLVDVLKSEGKDTSKARESILRAEAYLEDGTPELGAILLAVGARDWTELPDLVDRLSAADYRPNPYQEAALALLGERFESGHRMIQAGLERAPRNPHWAFLSAAAGAMSDADVTLPPWFGPDAVPDAALFLRGPDRRTPQDPRDAVVLYLLARDLRWTPWVLPRLGALETATGSAIWAPWLRLLVLDVRGATSAYDQSIRKLIRSNPRFGPGHDMAVELAEQRNPTEPLHPELVRARRVRLASLGEDLVADPIEIALARAGELAREGKYVEATQALRPVLQAGGPRQTEGRLMLGILLIRAGQPSLAATHLNQAAQKGPGVFRDVVIDSLLFSINDAIESAEENTPQRGALTPEDALGMLDGLAERYPLDPIVALARLERLELGEGETGARAAGILEQLFKQSGGKTIDQLRTGATKRWIEFLAPIASDVALDIIARDLELEPGNIALWQLGGYVAELRDETEVARRYYETLIAIDPRPRTGYALAELMIAEGASPREVVPILAQASRAQGGGSARAVYLRTVSEIRVSRPNLDGLLVRLEGLWASRERSNREVDPLDLGLLYADVLFRRGTLADFATLETLLAELESLSIGSLYEGDLVEALQGLRGAAETEAEKLAAAAPVGGGTGAGGGSAERATAKAE